MGSIIGGVAGGGEQQKQKVTPDAQAQAMNRLRIQELSNLFAQSPYAGFAQPGSDAYRPSPETMGLINQFTDPSQLLTPQEYLSQGLEAGLGPARNYMSEVARPEIMNTMALSGLESGGAVSEALAKAGAGVAMPYLTSLMGNLPGVQQTMQMGQGQMMGFSDLPRSLQAEDLLRRQGVVQTGLTGLPFTPGQTSKGGTSSLPLWNLFGTGGMI